MIHNEEREACTRNCWLLAAGIGLVLLVFLWFVVGWSFWQSIFTAILVAIIAGALMAYLFCARIGPGRGADDQVGMPREIGSSTGDTHEPRENVADVSTGVDTSGKVADQAVEPSGPVKAEASSSDPVSTSSSFASVRPSETSADPSGHAETAARKRDVDETSPDASATAAPAPAPASASKTAPPEHQAVADTPKTAEKPASAPADSDGKPEMLSAAREGRPDDLKRINGVGPKLEQTLNELGVYHFDQIASWREKDVAWVDERLRFKGRIERDDWIAQAETLAKGGETDFAARKRKT